MLRSEKNYGMSELADLLKAWKDKSRKQEGRQEEDRRRYEDERRRDEERGEEAIQRGKVEV